jgi:hypothetical protein
MVFVRQGPISAITYILILTGVMHIPIEEMAVISLLALFMFRFGRSRRMVHSNDYPMKLVP